MKLSFKNYCFVLSLLISGNLLAQQGIGTSAPHESAALEITSPDKGVLIPRLALTTSATLAPVIGTPDASFNGMLIYNTASSTTNGLSGEGFYVWQGGATGTWRRITTAEAGSFALIDTDGDTQIQVEEGGPGTDDDTIRFDAKGNELMSISENAIAIGRTTSTIPTIINRSGISFADINNTNGDADNYINNATLRLQSSNNALNFVVPGVANNRRAIIQASHASQGFSTSTGPLHLNPYGGGVSIGTLDRTTTLDVNGNARIRTLTTGNTATDKIVVAAANGLLRQVDATTVALEPWFGTDDNAAATENTEDMYAMGKIGIGTDSPTFKLETAGADSDASFNGIRVGKGPGDLNNTVVGFESLNSNAGGYRNTALGYQTLQNNTTGTDNTAVGSSALLANTGGSNNIAIGSASLDVNETGNFNIGIGTGSLGNSTLHSNIGIGGYALTLTTTGQRNTTLGYGTLQLNTTGSDNVAIGHLSGRNLVGGGDNTVTNNSVFIGREARAAADNQTNQIVIGHTAEGIGSNTVVLGNDAIVTTALKGDVGIGTTSPTEKLDVNGTARIRTLDAGDIATDKIVVATVSGVLKQVDANAAGIGTDDQNLSVGAGTATTSIIDIEGGNDITLEAGTGITLAETGNTITITGDSGTDDQNLSVGAGTATTSIIDIEGGNDVTLEAGTGITLAETGNTITIANNQNKLIDTDGDTQIQVEEGGPGTDDDTIRFDANGNQLMTIDENAISIGDPALTTPTRVARSGISFADINNTNADADNYINQGTFKVQSSNNALHFVVPGVANNRRAIIQASHSNPNFSTSTGPLHLNPYGGGVSIGTLDRSATLDVDGDARIRTLNAGDTATDKIVVATSTGVLKTVTATTVALEPWFGTDDNAAATENNEDMYAMGKIGIGTDSPTFKLETAGADSDASFNGIRVGKGPGDLNNTVVGFESLNSNAGGYRNTALGYQTLQNNTTGTDNTAVGSSALLANTEGNHNIAIGSASLDVNETGNFNIGIGTGSLGNSTSHSNIGIGGYALTLTTTGQRNTTLGYGTLQLNTTGSDNVAIGHLSGRNLVGGGDNTVTNNSVFIGREARAAADNQTNQIVIGHTAEGIGSNTVVLGNDAIVTTALKGDVGIGTTSPTEKLDVNGTARIRTLDAGDIATDEIVVATSSGVLKKISPAAVGGQQPWYTEGTTTGHASNTGNMFFSGNIGVATNTLAAGKVATFAGDVDIQGVLDPTKLIFSGDGSVGSFNPTTDNQYEIEFQEGRDLEIKSNTTNNIMHIESAGNVGIGTNSPTYKLQVGATAGGDASDALINGVRVGRGAADVTENTAVGFEALDSNTSNNFRNTAIGYQSLKSNGLSPLGAPQASDNTAIGYAALRANEQGRNNTAIGAEALAENRYASNNVAIGRGAASANVASSNTAIGAYALSEANNSTASHNTAIGNGALLANLTGNDNIGIGISAGSYREGSPAQPNTAPTRSIFIGSRALAQADNQTNQIVIGHEALGIGSNSVVLGNDDVITTALKGDVGIGTTGPTQKLDVNGNIRFRGQLFDGTNTSGTAGQFLSATAGGTEWTDVVIPTFDGVNPGTQIGNTLFWDGTDWSETEFLFHDTDFIPGAGNTINTITHSHYRPLNTIIGDYGSAMAISKNNDYLYVGGRNNVNDGIANQFYLSVVPLSNPAAPGAATRIVYSTTSNQYAQSLLVHGDRLYLTTRDKLHAYNISNPASPSLLGTLSFSLTYGRGFDMAIKGNYLYRSSQGGNVLIVDISNPAAMTNAGTIAGNKGIFVHIFGESLYLGNDDNATNAKELKIYRLTNPTAPTLMTTIDDPGFNEMRSVEVLGGAMLYVVTSSSLVIYDISDPSAPSKVTKISAGQNGFPANFSPSGGLASGLRLNRGNLFISDSNNDIVHVVNVEDALNPRYVTGFTNSNLTYPFSITSNGGRYVYVLNSNLMGVETIDLEFNGAYVSNKIGIGTTTPDQMLSVNGNASKTGGGSWAAFSDQRIKHSIKDYNKGLQEVLQLRPVYFNYNYKSGYDTEKTHVGVLAQEVEQVLPGTVTEFDDSKGKSGLKDKKQFDSSEILWTLVNAIKELNAENEKLKARIEALENE